MTTRRGVALLLVLATLVVSLTAVAGLARAAAGARLRHQSAEASLATDDLLGAAEAPILDWLTRHAPLLALPPEAESPRFLVLDRALTLGGRSARLTIAAYDQCGMVPADTNDRSLLELLPPDVASRLSGLRSSGVEPSGIDIFIAGRGGGRPVFPQGDGGPLAIGELVATHAGKLININTAPLGVLERVLGARGMSGIDAVVESRRLGRPSSPGEPARDGRAAPVPLPVAMSTAWAFRVDCVSGRSRRSWWVVYADTGSSWRRAQRFAIDG